MNRRANLQKHRQRAQVSLYLTKISLTFLIFFLIDQFNRLCKPIRHINILIINKI